MARRKARGNQSSKTWLEERSMKEQTRFIRNPAAIVYRAPAKPWGLKAGMFGRVVVVTQNLSSMSRRSPRAAGLV